MTQWYSEYSFLGSAINIDYLLVSLLFAFILVLVLNQHLSLKYRSLKKQLSQLQNEVRAINSGNLGMGHKMNQFAEEIANFEFGHISEDIPVVSNKTYQQAGLLLSRGATIEEVVESCDIAPAEAELLAIMRHSRPAKQALA